MDRPHALSAIPFYIVWKVPLAVPVTAVCAPSVIVGELGSRPGSEASKSGEIMAKGHHPSAESVVSGGPKASARKPT